MKPPWFCSFTLQAFANRRFRRFRVFRSWRLWFDKKLYILIPILLLLSLCACQRLPEAYPPPEQRQSVVGEDMVRASMMVNMNDPNAKSHFVKDISATLEGATWRWTGKRPTCKTLLVKTTGLKYVVDFTLWKGNMEQTGPVTVAFFIGDRLLEKVRYQHPGYQHYEIAVTPDWIQTADETIMAAEIDKLYVSPEDGLTLGFILSKMGFERQ